MGEESDFQGDAGKLALKLKLEPTREQMLILDEAFKKWAMICNRFSYGGETIDDLRPKEENPELQFNSTQLNSAKMDVSDLRGAMKRQGERISRELDRFRFRISEVEECINDSSKRDCNPERPTNFRPLKWMQAGYLKARYHTLKYYQSEIRKNRKKEEKLVKTIEKIERGRMHFKPKRITLWPTSINISFGSGRIALKPFANDLELETRVIYAPEKLSPGKSQKASMEYMKKANLNLLAYSVNQLLFGLNRSQKMLATAKKPEKVEKFKIQMDKKDAGFEKKLNELQGKWFLGRGVSEKELSCLMQVKKEFFKTGKVEFSEDYVSVLRTFAEEMALRKEFLNLKKYPVLLRKPMKRYKQKSLENLKPDQWKYYLQFGYEPVLERKPPFLSSTIMGIDRGLTHLLAVAIFSPKEKKFVFNFLEPNPILDWRWKMRKMRRSIQHMEQRIRAQKGEHIKENQMKKRLRSMEDRIEHHYHLVSAKIVALAKKYKSDIVFESLSNMKQHGRKKSARTRDLNYALSLFDYSKVASLVLYKARLNGIRVYDIMPGMTSKTCATCLLQSRESAYIRGKTYLAPNRKTYPNMKIGHCPLCHKNERSMIDADINAARVIALCKHKNLNDPRPFGSRWVFKRF